MIVLDANHQFDMKLSYLAVVILFVPITDILLLEFRIFVVAQSEAI